MHLPDPLGDTRLLGPYITEVLEVVGGSSLFCQFGVGAAWWPENRGFAPLYRGAEGRFSGARWFLSLTFQTRFSRDQNLVRQAVGVS